MLVVNINLTLDIPVVGRYGISPLVLSTDIVTIVDNGLLSVYEVT